MKIDDITEAIGRWAEEKGRNVQFVGSFFEFDDKGEIIDDRMLAYGSKDTLLISLGRLVQDIAEDKDDFVNW